MDKGIRAARDQVAMERILAASEVLAGRFKLQLPAAIPTTGRDKATLAMQQREIIADLLDMLVAATEPAATEPKPKAKTEPKAKEE